MKTFLTILGSLIASTASAGEPPVAWGTTPPVAWVASAPAPKAKCTYCTNCVCKDGDCPSKCAVSDYSAVYARVQRGERVTVTVGPGGFALPGVAHGTYDCYLDVSGRQMMQARQVVTAPAPVSSTGFVRVCGPNGCKLVPANR